MLKPSVTIIGYGQFGTFLAKHLVGPGEVTIMDKNLPIGSRIDIEGKSVEVVSREALVDKDFIIPAVPVQFLEEVVVGIKDFVGSNTVFADVASVKEKPKEIYERQLDTNQPYLLTHPMFGPESGKDGIAGLQIVMCEDSRISEPIYTMVKMIMSQSLKLKVLEMTAKEHDEQVAYVQGLSHFMCRALSEMNIPESKLSTPAYDYLLKIREMLRNDSWELFETIENMNSYSADVRASFMVAAQAVEEKLGAVVITKDRLSL